MSSKIVSRASASEVKPISWASIRQPAQASTVSFAENVENDSAANPRIEERLRAIEQQAERRVQEAREAGRREGEAAGRQAALRELQPHIDRLAAALHEVAGLRPLLRNQAEADLVKLAIAIARRILNRELSTDPDAIAGLAKVGLEKVRAQELLRVRVHPDHQVPIRSALSRLGASAVDVLTDPVLERGGVTFETVRGRLDVSVETQLREIDRGLADRLGGTV